MGSKRLQEKPKVARWAGRRGSQGGATVIRENSIVPFLPLIPGTTCDSRNQVRFLVPGINGKNGAMDFSLIINRARVGQAGHGAHGSLAIQHSIVKSRVEERINFVTLH